MSRCRPCEMQYGSLQGRRSTCGKRNEFARRKFGAFEEDLWEVSGCEEV